MHNPCIYTPVSIPLYHTSVYIPIMTEKKLNYIEFVIFFNAQTELNLKLIY